MARRETAPPGLIVAGVFVLGNSSTTAGADADPGQPAPRPEPTVSYPIAFPGMPSGR
ncbi:MULTISPECIES: hypothetical protein [unclassified Streptomyces]|uniref:hypothetical protein n=1 Tax=unclassified Streptomyces TaxID=2593676 RepID=UPI00224D7CBA|nr:MULTISPECIES: hypothetical protein [unclassified Streptomyces]MCX4527039.1 hypothetical protein [Streptomyces sp. NBC_01551]MCX4542401.1 hypothetical protein [Streptomyces sp. NBC_01565]